MQSQCSSRLCLSLEGLLSKFWSKISNFDGPMSSNPWLTNNSAIFAWLDSRDEEQFHDYSGLGITRKFQDFLWNWEKSVFLDFHNPLASDSLLLQIIFNCLVHRKPIMTSMHPLFELLIPYKKKQLIKLHLRAFITGSRDNNYLRCHRENRK